MVIKEKNHQHYLANLSRQLIISPFTDKEAPQQAQHLPLSLPF